MTKQPQWKEEFDEKWESWNWGNGNESTKGFVKNFVESLLRSERDRNEQRLCGELLEFIQGKEYEIFVLRFMEKYRERHHPEILSEISSR